MSVSPGHFGISGFAFPWIGIPSTAEVSTGVTFGAGNALTGTLDPGGGGTVPAASDVRLGTSVGVTTGTLAVPATNKVLTGTAVDATTGTLTLPTAAQCLTTATFGVGGNSITGTVTLPAASVVLSTATFGPGGATSGTYIVAAAGAVKTGVTYGAASAQTGTYDGSDRYTDAGVAHVESGVAYRFNSLTTNRTGTLDVSGGIVPAAGDVRDGVPVAATVGTLVVPGESNVRVGIAYGAGGDEFTGTLDASAAAPGGASSARLLRVSRGAAYRAEDGLAFDFTDPGGAWPDLTGATAVLRTSRGASFTMSVVAATGPAKRVRLELSNAQSATLTAGVCKFRAEATQTDGDVIPLDGARGWVLVT